MNLLLVYKSGYSIPFSIFYCNTFHECGSDLVIEHDQETIVISEWSYYDSIESESIADEESIVSLIKQFVTIIREM